MSVGRALLLPRLDLSQPLTREAIRLAQDSFVKYGAIRILADQIQESNLKDVFSEAYAFFQEDANTKKLTMGYSPLHSESVRGKINIPKQTLYWFSKKHLGGHRRPPKALRDSVELLHQDWTQFRRVLLPVFFDILQGKNSTVDQYQTYSHDTLGIHLYESQRLEDHDTYFNPPHIDSGVLTVLFPEPGDRSDNLEIADLGSTNKVGSEAIGGEAKLFQRVAIEEKEAILVIGSESERIFGRDSARACVHGVRRPDLPNQTRRMSLAFFLRLEEIPNES